jgi:mRNA interferase MazF
VWRGEIWWANIPEPVGSGPGGRRPVVVVSADRYNASGIRTVVVAMMTTNLSLARFPGNFRINKRLSGLPHNSVVNVSQLFTLDRGELTDQAGQLAGSDMRSLDDGLKMVLDL